MFLPIFNEDKTGYKRYLTVAWWDNDYNHHQYKRKT